MKRRQSQANHVTGRSGKPVVVHEVIDAGIKDPMARTALAKLRNDPLIKTSDVTIDPQTGKINLTLEFDGEVHEFVHYATPDKSNGKARIKKSPRRAIKSKRAQRVK